MPPKLTLAATPIGNLEDGSTRLIQTLASADSVFCEDTRHSRKLLQRWDITQKLHSFHDHSPEFVLEHIQKLWGENLHVVYISDAGMPAVSDPGLELVRKAHDLGVEVDVLPGPSAPTTALVHSGFDPIPHAFLGFFPKKEKQKQERLNDMLKLNMTTIHFESPQRLNDTLAWCVQNIPNTRMAICRELTKTFQEIKIGLPDELIHLRETWKGEIVLVFEAVTHKTEEISIAQAYQNLLNEGLKPMAAVRKLSQARGVSKKEINRLLQDS